MCDGMALFQWAVNFWPILVFECDFVAESNIVSPASIRILVVEDFEPFRRYCVSRLEKRPGVEIVGEVSDGVTGVHRAKDLQPDLILLDVGLPKMNGIEAARQIVKVSPSSRILFVSQESSPEVVQEVLRLGARGYIIKSDVGTELLTAVDAVHRGETFLSSRLAHHRLTDSRRIEGGKKDNTSAPTSSPKKDLLQRHEVGFYGNDRQFLEHVERFVGAALESGGAAIVVATESHRDSLIQRLHSRSLDLGAAIAEGRYIALDAAEAVSAYMHNGKPDPVRFFELFGQRIAMSGKTVKRENARVAVFGEGVQLLREQGNVEAAIEVEKLCNKLVRIHNIDLLCAYCVTESQPEMDYGMLQRICAEHSAVRHW
jgi:DNA-binding NarL/FixJ family response regulator